MTQIARALEESIALHATHKRLSRNLANERLEDNLESTESVEYVKIAAGIHPISRANQNFSKFLL